MAEERSANTDPQPGATVSQLMIAEDVAKILRIAKKTVHKLVREGRLGCVQVTEKDRRFTQEQVDDYIKSRSIGVRIDRRKGKGLISPSRKGGEKSFGDCRTSLLKEMSQWR